MPPLWLELSATKREKIRKATEKQIDEFMERAGYSNPAERTDKSSSRWFNCGSAKGHAGIIESDSDGEMFLGVESLVMKLPSDENKLLPLMRQLLEANMSLTGSARIAISGKSVFVCGTVPLVELVPGDVPAHIYSVMMIAGTLLGFTDLVDLSGLLSPADEGVKPEGESQKKPPVPSRESCSSRAGQMSA